MQDQIISQGTVDSVDKKSVLAVLSGNRIKNLDMQTGGVFVNRSKIEWCDYTWNPITGCQHNCPYCYAKKMTARFAGNIRLNKMAKKDYSIVPAANGSEDLYVLDAPMLNETGHPLVYPFGFAPTLHRYRMNTLDKLKMGNNIFVGAMADMFGAWVPQQWIEEIFAECLKYPQHNYMFLTKNPQRYYELEQAGILPHTANMWYGTSVTTVQQMEDAKSVFAKLPLAISTFFSIEPILEDVASAESWQDAILETEWIIIGAQTGRDKEKVIPKREWISKVVLTSADKGIPVFMKDSLLEIVGKKNMCQDFPRQLQHSEISPKMKKKLFDICAGCKTHLKKSSMITLLARSKRGEQPKQFGFMCKECFKKFCKHLDLDIPKLAELTESVNDRKEDYYGKEKKLQTNNR